MRALVFRSYGAPEEVMELVDDRDIRATEDGEVLVRVECASVNAADTHMVRATYPIVRLVLGLRRPAAKNQVLGMDIAGTVEAVGPGVDGFGVGDRVAADIRGSRGGGFAESALAKADELVPVPDGVSFEQAATVPISGQAAMMGVVLCEIESGDTVLINGASGGVGSFGVQIAKARGAHVVAVCSGAKSDAVKSWGADEVIDYKESSDHDLGVDRYNAIFDAACFERPTRFRACLKPDGRYVLVGGSYYYMLQAKLFGRLYARGPQRFRALSQDVPVPVNIENVFGMIARGEVKPAVHETITLEDIPGAIHRLEQGAVSGKIVARNQL